MKILYTIADLQPESGGPTRSVSALAAAVAAQGAEVDLFALEFGNGASPPLIGSLPSPISHRPSPRSPRIHLVPCHTTLGRRLKWSAAFHRTLNSQPLTLNSPIPTHSPTHPLTHSLSHLSFPPSTRLLHDNGLWLPTNHSAARVARATGIPFIISPRGMLTPWALRFRGFKKRLAWHLYQLRDLRSAHVLHATSREEAGGFRALGLTQPIAIIPNGVELPKAGAGSQEPGARSAETSVHVSRFTFHVSHPPSSISHLPSSRCTALFLSRIHPVKGLLDLVEAWHAVRPQNWRVLIAGGDENGHLAEVKTEIGKLKLGNEFDFVGEVADDQKWALYLSANLFVLPSKSENFGIAVAEALAAGLPVITTRGAPWEELLTHRCGWWVDIGPAPLAAALRHATTLSDAERREMGARGRQLIAGKYTWPAVAQQMLAVYRWMLGQADRPECVQTA